HRRPTARLGFGGDEAASDAELAQAAADAAGVPACSQFRVESEGTAEDVDGGVAIGRGEFGAEVFECGRQLERSRCAFEESDRLAEIRVAPLEQTADVSRRRRDRVDAGVQLRSPPAAGERELRERVVLCGKCDAREL